MTIKTNKLSPEVTNTYSVSPTKPPLPRLQSVPAVRQARVHHCARRPRATPGQSNLAKFSVVIQAHPVLCAPFTALHRSCVFINIQAGSCTSKTLRLAEGSMVVSIIFSTIVFF